MANILLVEPDYASKFPPLGLMRISAYHKDKGDAVTFVRGKDASIRGLAWNRVYVASLFTYELARTVDTIKYYAGSVSDPRDIYVGGIAVTLMPSYVEERVRCTVVTGPLDRPGMLGSGTPAIADLVPDYALGGNLSEYLPKDSYFCRVTLGCVRKCPFCAVPVLEPHFKFHSSLRDQLDAIKAKHGEKQNLVILDNNILGLPFRQLQGVIDDIKAQGFGRDSKRNGRKRTVDFNQAIDARLITERVAKVLGDICLDPVRLAFDHDDVEAEYRTAVERLAHVGFGDFTNYVMFNFNDTPESFYHRARVGVELSDELGVRVSSFPMRYVPVNSTSRGFISEGWKWRTLRGIQCVLHATHGLVSPKRSFFEAAFGANLEEFLEITSMPDRYIMERRKFENAEAQDWRLLYRALSTAERSELLDILAILNKSKNRKAELAKYAKFAPLLEHYYPGGETPHG